MNEAYIYGFWAVGREGEPSDDTGDIFMLICGAPSRSEV